MEGGDLVQVPMSLMRFGLGLASGVILARSDPKFHRQNILGRFLIMFYPSAMSH